MILSKNICVLEDLKINVKFKLSALWAAVMFLYVYADIKAFFRPEIIDGIMAGKVGGFEITQGFLLTSAIMMAIPNNPYSHILDIMHEHRTISTLQTAISGLNGTKTTKKTTSGGIWIPN